MDLHFLGFAFAVPVPSGQRLVAVRRAIQQDLGEDTSQDQVRTRTFDGPDAGLPQGQAACVVAPMRLSALGRQRAGSWPQEAFLEALAQRGAQAARLVDPGVLVAAGWQAQGEAEVRILLEGPGGHRHFVVEVGTWRTVVGGQLDGLLQGELLAGMARADHPLLAEAFPHALAAVLDERLAEGSAGAGRGRL